MRTTVRLAVWLPGLIVALGAAVATAHGLFEVALAAGVPAEIAWIYPLITDGLALVAYAATACLGASAGRYAWLVVVTAAGLSGLAQACYLAGGVGSAAPAALRFGVGAWPAIAAAIVAHLLHLIIASGGSVQRTTEQADAGRTSERIGRSAEAAVERPEREAVRHLSDAPVQPASDPRVQPYTRPSDPNVQASDAPVRDRAQAAAQLHAARNGELPTVTQLMAMANVSRGTAGDALKALRNRPAPLHLVNPDDNTRTQP